MGTPISEPKPWTSMRGSKATWPEQACRKVAMELIARMPTSVVKALEAGEIVEVPLLTMPKGSINPSTKHLKANKLAMIGFLKASPSKVPSQFFGVDVYLMMDTMLGGNLFVGTVEEKLVKATAAAKQIVIGTG